jgi:hypothetical protein
VAHVKRAAPGRTDTGRCRDGPGSTFLTNQPIRSGRLGNAHLDVQAGRHGHVDEGVRPNRSILPRIRQEAALERLAEVALRTMQRANAAPDQALEEIEATKAHFAAKRREAAPA